MDINAFLDPVLEPSCSQNPIFTMNVNDFRGVVLEAQKWAKQVPCKSRWPQVQQSWCQIVQIIAHLFAHMLKRFVNVKPPRN